MFTVISKIEQFGLGDNKRRYLVATMPFKDARKLFSADRYRADSGIGEQRELVMAHVKTIRKEMEDGNFTPTSVSAGLRDKQEGVVVVEKDGEASLSLTEGATLPLLDGGHRFSALEFLFENEKYKEDAAASAVTVLIMLDGNTKKDFLNLQKGRPVDKSHLHSLSVQENLLKKKDADALILAYQAAKLLNEDANSPFFKQIRFDSVGVSGIPISSLSSKGASDIATSLVGGAKIAIHAKRDAAWLAKCVTTSFTFLKSMGAKDLLEVGFKLCPPPQGTKGSATMLIGVGNLLAYRLSLQNLDGAATKDAQKLVEVALETLSGKVSGNFSGPVKRDAMGSFAEKFFEDLISPENSHFGVPKELVLLLSSSTFSVPKVEKEKVEKAVKELKPKKEKVFKKKKEKEPEPELSFDDATPPVETTKELVEVGVTERAPWDDDEQQG